MNTALTQPITKILDELPGLAPFPTAYGVLGLPRTKAYSCLAAGTFPVPVIRIGRNAYCRTADLRRFLGLETSPITAPAEALDAA